MAIPDQPNSPPIELSLAPMDDEALEIELIPGHPGKIHADARSGKERRKVADRRIEIRFESDRRSGKDRRAKRSWEPGGNL